MERIANVSCIKQQLYKILPSVYFFLWYIYVRMLGLQMIRKKLYQNSNDKRQCHLYIGVISFLQSAKTLRWTKLCFGLTDRRFAVNSLA